MADLDSTIVYGYMQVNDILDVRGSGSFPSITISATTGTSPFVISSTSLVANLNADLLDGQEGSYYLSYSNLTNVPSTFAPSSHTHGNITNAGAIGSTSGLPIITTTSGVLTTGSFGSSSGTFCQGNDSRLSDSRTPTAHNFIDTTGHPVSGLTTGHFLKATGATTYAFGAHGLTYTDVGAAAASHAHGNITSDGKIGSTSGLPIITTTAGALTVGSFGSTSGTFCQGNDSRLSDARTPTSHNNTYHSETYITSSGVTYEALSTNGDIGTGSSQVAAGNHTHSYSPVAFSTIAVSGQTSVVADSTGDTLTFIGGTNVTITTDATGDSITIASAHPSITAASSVNNSGRTYIQDITLDSNGHVTGLVSATETVTDTNTTYTFASGTTNGAFSVTPSGSSSQSVSIYGLGSAAYTASTAYAASSHAHGNITSAGAIGSTANLPLITTTSGVVTVGSFGTGANTFCQGNDSRLSDARTPTAHNFIDTTGHPVSGLTTGHFLKATGATTYAFGAHGLTYTDVGAAASSHTHGNITSDGKIGSTSGLMIKTTTSGVLTTLAAGSAGQFLRYDGTWATPPDTNTTYSAGTGLTLTTTTFSVNYGSTSTTACVGNDARLSDARTPLSHAHGNITNDGKIGSTANLPLITTTSGLVTVGSFGSTANTFCQGNDSRLSDTRTPVSHDNTYHSATYITSSGVTYENLSANGDIGTGSSQVAAGNHSHSVTESMLSLSDNTTADVSTTKHGLTPKAPNDTSKFLRGDGTWAAPSSGGLTQAQVMLIAYMMG